MLKAVEQTTSNLSVVNIPAIELSTKLFRLTAKVNRPDGSELSHFFQIIAKDKVEAFSFAKEHIEREGCYQEGEKVQYMIDENDVQKPGVITHSVIFRR